MNPASPMNPVNPAIINGYLSQPLVVLALWQPHATLCVAPDPEHDGQPAKVHETRSWSRNTHTGISWKPIPSWPKYEVSDDGQVRRGGRMLRLRAHENRGHLYFTPQRGKKCYVHRAVLEAFVGPCPDGQEGRHLDGRPANNRVGNLAWGTPLQNADDKRRHGTQPRGEKAGTHKLTEADVLAIRRRLPNSTLRALAQEYGVSHTAIRRAANGMKWAHVEASHG
jgi:hypothetical protein